MTNKSVFIYVNQISIYLSILNSWNIMLYIPALYVSTFFIAMCHQGDV